MNYKTTAGFALLLTILAILTFGGIAFLGMEYLFEGNHTLAILSTISGVILLSYCLKVMCRSKASRNKRSGLPREIFAIIVAIIILAAGSIPFTQFVYVLDHKQMLHKCLTETVQQVRDIDSLYKDYAQERVRKYKGVLYKSRYSSDKVKLMTKSLERRLMPAQYDTVHAQRKEWLGSLTEASVWNISTPRNLHYIVKAGQEWTAEYNKVSSIIYRGEEASAFGTESTAFEPNESHRLLSEPQKPDWRSIMAVLATISLILTTYIHIRRPKSTYVGSHR